MLIEEAKLLVLRAAYERGESTASAALVARVACEAARRQFKRFALDGVARRSPRFPGLPRYDGPDWIGKAAPSRQ
jgi:hypothetical protein